MYSYDKIRLTDKNINGYLKYLAGSDSASISITKEYHINDFEPLLQKNYGEALDCTLTSITACINYLKPGNDTYDIYDVVEKNAKKYGYNGKLWGTFSVFIRQIYNASRKAFGLSADTHWRYFKNVGFNFNKIISILDTNTPLVLSLHKDGRNYYSDHSITAIGYATYNVNGTEKKFIKVYDNWTTTITYVDYDAMSCVSCINF